LRIDRSLDGLDLCREAHYGSDRVRTILAKSGRALGSAFRGMPSAPYDFIFGAIRSRAVQDR
jgi:hypothetical protein